MADGLARAGFDLDLRYGQGREDAFGYVLLRATVEHKADCKWPSKTGNLFIEYRQYGKPSGLSTTTADYWAFEYMTNRWLIVPTEELRELVKLAARDPKRRVKRGDNNKYSGVLLPIDWLVCPWKAVR